MAAKRSSLLGATLAYGVGRFVPQVAIFLLLPLYSRFLTPTDLGAVELFTLLQTLVVVVGRVGLPGAISRFYSELGETRMFRSLVTTITWTSLGCTVHLCGVLAAFIPGSWVQSHPTLNFWPLGGLALASAATQQLGDIQFRLLQVRERVSTASALTLATGVAITALNVGFVVGAELGALGVLLAGFSVNLVRSIQAGWSHRRDISGRYDLGALRTALRYGGPLVPHHLASWADQAVGRTLLGSLASAQAVGLLGLGARLVSPLQVLRTALATAYNPIFFRWRSQLTEGDAMILIEKVLKVLTIWAGVAVVGASWLGPRVVENLLDPAYAPVADLLWPLACARMFHVMYVGVAPEIFYTKKTERITYVFLLGLVVNGIIVLFLVDAWTVQAAALGEVGASLVGLGYTWFLTRSTFPIRLDSVARVFAVGSIVLGGMAGMVGPLAPPLAWCTALLLVIMVVAAGYGLTIADLRELQAEARQDVGNADA